LIFSDIYPIMRVSKESSDGDGHLLGARPTERGTDCGRLQCKPRHARWRRARLCGHTQASPQRRRGAPARVLLLPLGVGVLRLPRPRWPRGFRRRSLPQVRRYGADTLLAGSNQPAGWGRERSESASGGSVSLPVVRPCLPFYGLCCDAPGAEVGYRRPVGAAQDQHVGV
jgi:hypothetical protein